MMNKIMLIMAGTAGALGLSLGSIQGAEKEIDLSKLPPASTKANVTFAQDIKPLFDKGCVMCHGPRAAKGNLHLDTREGVLKGSEDGPVVVSGNGAKSLLVHSLAGLSRKPMPPQPKSGGQSRSFSAADIGLVRAWIDQGAK